MEMEYKIIKDNIIDTFLRDRIYFVTSEIEECYPEHKKWFYEKFVPELASGKRTIVYCELDNKIVGVVFLKHTQEERKICTIFVDKEFRRMNIGTELLEYAFKILQTEKPLITFSEEKQIYFKNIIKKYNWELKEVKKDLYQKGKKELIYNE